MDLGSPRTLRDWFIKNEQAIRELHSAVHAALAIRQQGKTHEQAWHEAAREFHERYEELAYPGGFHDGLQRLAAAEPDAIEVALCFVELRPYFFRSGYMFTTLLRRLKRLTLTPEQASRLQAVKDRQRKWCEGRTERLLARYARQFDCED